MKFLLSLMIGFMLSIAPQPAAAGSFVLLTTGTQDTTIYDQLPTFDYGHIGNLGTRWSTGAGLKQCLVKFDLSSIPSNATITAAYLYLTPVQGSGTPTIPLKVYQAWFGWSESSTWSTINPAADTGDLSQANAKGSYASGKWHVRNITRNWIENGHTNNGFLVSYTGSSGSYPHWQFASTETTAPGINKPQLEVRYTTP